MPQHSYKQLEEVYQREVNKEHKPNPARMHPMSSRQGKGCLEMPINQAETAQYSQDSQSDSDQDFEVTTVNPNAESTWLDGTLMTATCHTIQNRRPTTWTSTDIREHLATTRAHTSGTAEAQPAKKTGSGTSKVSWTKHEACQMTLEN